MLETVAAILVVALLAAYGTWLAGRLDRLEARIEASRQSLEAQLVRRAATAERLAGLLPPSPEREELGRAARAALAAPPTGREEAESALTRAARVIGNEAAPPVPSGAVPWEVLAELAEATGRVQLARQFHNDAVHALRALRSRRIVRVMRLSARRAAPVYFEFDDGRV
jgi:hypothetical protein